MHLIDNEVPVTAHAGYRLTDPSLRFRFVYPQRGQIGAVLASIREEIAPYCGEMFEQLSLDLFRRGILFSGSSYSRPGRWRRRSISLA